MRARLAWTLSLAAVVALGGFSYAQTGATVISDIRQESVGESTRLVVVSNGPLTYTYYSPDPLTLIVDIPDVDASKVPSKLSVGNQEVESLRVTPMTRGEGRSLARLEIRMARRAPYSIYSKENTVNIVFEHNGENTATEAPATPAVSASTAPETKTADAPSSAPATTRKIVKATRVLGVTHKQENGQLAVTVLADGHLRYQDFFLGNPDRLVVDLRDVASGPGKVFDMTDQTVKRMRLAQFSATSPKVARLVLELSRRSPYRVVEATDGIKIVFGEGAAINPAPLAALHEADAVSAASVTAAAPAVAAPAVVVPAVGDGAAPAAPAVMSASLQLDAPPTLAVPVPIAAELPSQNVSGGPSPESFEAKTIATGEKKFTGHPISLDFKDGDLQDIFRLFADISGLNVVVNPGVSGKVTLKLTEVPWDQALDLILKTNGLGYTLDDNVIRIAKLADLQKEELDKRKLQEEKALAGDLQVWRKPLSYAKGDALQPTVQKVALSPRGNITLDARTNTMIITDLPANIEKAKDLILDLDRATPQVEIEARIVVTTRAFSRALGIQWGFLNQQVPQFGSTTNYAFPHSIILNGGALANDSGISPTQLGLAGPAGIGPTSRGYAVNLPAGGANTAIGVSMGNVLGTFNLDAALTALETHGRGRILSTPKVTTQNNQSAEISQGVDIPYSVITGSQGAAVGNTQFKKAALTLRVTPQITDAGTVILSVDVQNDSPDFSRAINGQNPPINTQSAKTNVLVNDGATAVIGGIYQATEQTSRGNTPFLGDLPIIGNLFKNKQTRMDNAELIVFITPRIIKG
jgi:type IV pilus secretin PilQ/predicted competence protein